MPVSARIPPRRAPRWPRGRSLYGIRHLEPGRALQGGYPHFAAALHADPGAVEGVDGVDRPAGNLQTHLQRGRIADGHHLVRLPDLLPVPGQDAPAAGEGGGRSHPPPVHGDRLRPGVPELLDEVEQRLELEVAFRVGDPYRHPWTPG